MVPGNISLIGEVTEWLMVTDLNSVEQYLFRGFESHLPHPQEQMYCGSLPNANLATVALVLAASESVKNVEGCNDHEALEPRAEVRLTYGIDGNEE